MDENVTDCPLSIVGLDGEIDGDVKAGLTTKLLVYDDVTVVGCESVNTTLASNGEFEGKSEFVVIVLLHVVPLVIIVFTSIYLLGVMAFATNTFTVYGAVPPVITPLNVIDCPWSSVSALLDMVIVGEVYADCIVNVFDSTLFVVSGVEAESVIITFASTVFPTSSDGIVQAKLFDDVDKSVYNEFAITPSVMVLVIT